ncbi:DUF3885 domain-containing protein [Sphaerimonospora mesophila]|uniref:DUF3885 domain-containing protein n=1 Tax=Sphaerimonospora mesophila TaxID=37483 RepID=UPI000AAA3198
MPVTDVPGSRRPDLSALWRERWPLCPPLAYELKNAYHDRWVRFHSLPDSKRYADDEAEYAILLHRYNTVLGPAAPVQHGPRRTVRR